MFLIFAVSAAPIVISYALFYWWTPKAHTNYGQLLDPRQLPDVPLQLFDGSAFRFSQLKGKWVLLHVDSGTCEARCRNKMYQLRQVRLTQGKEMQRIERAWLVDDGAKPQPGLVAEYQGTWLVNAKGSAILKHLPTQSLSQDHIYLVDPLGNLMLRFPKDADPGRMVKDLTRLLKFSRIG